MNTHININSKTIDWTVFVLRRIDEDSVEYNTILGGFYTIFYKNRNEKEFNELTKDWDEKAIANMYGVIQFFDDSLIPLMKNSDYYVMMDNGNTFSNISDKK